MSTEYEANTGSVFGDLRRATSMGPHAVAAFVHQLFAAARQAKWRSAGFQHDYWDRLDGLCAPGGIGDIGGSIAGYGAPGLYARRKKSRENYVFQLYEAQKPIIVENGIRFDLLPTQGDDAETAIFLQDCLDYQAERDGIRRRKLRKFASYLLKRGTAVGKVVWNPFAENFLTSSGERVIAGNVETFILDPKMVYFDPFATSIDDAAYIIVAYFVDRDQLAERFGADALEGDPDARTSGFLKAGSPVPADQPGEWSYQSDRKEDERKQRGVFVIEMWIRPPKFAPTQQIEAIPDEVRAAEERAIAEMSGGRVILVAGGVVLHDGPNPYRHQKFPFILAQNYDVEDSPFGRSTPEVLAPLQAELDWINDHIRAYIKLVSTPFLTIPRDAMIHFGQLSAKLLPLLRPATGQASQWIRYVAPPPIPSQLFQRKADIIAAMRKMEGIDEINTEVIRSRQQAAATISLVKEATESRIRGKIDNINGAYRRWAELAISCMQQFWEYDRVVRLTGRRDEMGNPIPLRVSPEQFADVDLARFDIRVEVAPGQALSRAVQYAQLIELDARGVLGAPEPSNYARRKKLAEAAGVPGVLDMIVAEEAKSQRMAREAATSSAALAAARVRAGAPPLPPMEVPGAAR